MTTTSSPSDEPSKGHRLGRVMALFENALWAARFSALVAVLGSLVASLAMIYVATMDVVYLVMHLGSYVDPALSLVERKELHTATLVDIVEVVDGYLLAAILLIFAFGLFELFIAPFNEAKSSRGAAVLVIRDLDDLKSRLGKVVLLIMIVKFFEDVLTIESQRPFDLLAVAAGIALVATALWLSKSPHHPTKEQP